MKQKYKRALVAFTTLIALLTGGLLFYSTLTKENFQETIANYPIDETKNFAKTTTFLQLVEQNDEDEYILKWKTNSEINEKVYLSHDISLLFEDGRLKETMSTIAEEQARISQKSKINGEDSGHFEAITFHYRQMHYPNDITKSVQHMSYDQLYILDSPLSPLEVFKEPKTNSEKEGKRVLDTIIKQNLEYTWNELIDFFNIDRENYYEVPLTALIKFNSETLPTLTVEETRELLATTWSGIYQYYFLGIEKHDGSLISPVGSSVPLVLFHHTYSHIIVIYTSSEGNKYHIVKNTGIF